MIINRMLDLCTLQIKPYTFAAEIDEQTHKIQHHDRKQDIENEPRTGTEDC